MVKLRVEDLQANKGDGTRFRPSSTSFPYVNHLWKFESKPTKLAGRRGGGMTARRGLRSSIYYIYIQYFNFVKALKSRRNIAKCCYLNVYECAVQ